MKSYAIVTGLKLGKDWLLTSDLIARLDHAATMYKRGVVMKIIVSGRWTIWYDWLGVQPPVTESKAMKRYLIKNQIPAADIITDSFSKDTIGNLFGLKRILKSDKKTRIHLICATNHEVRLRYLCSKIIPDHNVEYIALPSSNFNHDVVQNEDEIFEQQKTVIEDIVTRKLKKPNYRIYSHPYYKNQESQVKQLLATHPEVLRSPIDAPNVVHDLMNTL